MADLAAVANTGVHNPVGQGYRRLLESTRDGALFTAGWLLKLALQGRIFTATDGDANDTVTGQTSFADTAPSFLLRVPAGTVCVPLCVFLNQTGNVAGGAIDVNMALSLTADAYASSGTSEAIFSHRSDTPVAPLCTLYSTPTTTTALLTKQVKSWHLGPDISTAEGAVAELLWTPERYNQPLILVGASSLGIFTSAASTGPTWNWSITWAELPANAVV